MADTSNTDETVVTDASKTAVTPPTPPATVTPPVDKAPDAAVEQLKKELEQQRMRANQLENEKKTREEAEAKAKADELAEQNQFKDLYEQEKTKREAIESETAEKERKATLEEAKQKVLSEYSDGVKELADETGLELTSDDETAVAAFKEKLEKINTRLGTAKISANNPKSPGGQAGLSGNDLREVLQDENKFHEYITSTHPVIASMTKRK